MKHALSYLFSSFIALVAISGQAMAYPDLMQPMGTNGEPIKVFKDHDQDVYWYMPTSIEPWTRDDTYRSTLYKDDVGKVMSFIFRGQASVDEKMLARVAKSLNLPLANFTPIFLEYSKDLTCQNIYNNDPNVTWLYPTQIGNYLEVVPVSIRVKGDSDLVNEVYQLINGGGLACTVSVGFKAYSMAYRGSYTFDLNQVYSRFESGLHGGWWFFEVDIHNVLQQMNQEGVFKFHNEEDTSIPQTLLDQKMAAAFEDLEKQITALIFTPAASIPPGGLPASGKPFSFRTDYVRSDQKSHHEIHVSSDKVTVKTSQIGLRLGVK